MKIYAIQNINTKLFLSEGKRLARTSADFSDKPRLFNNKRAATNAMTCWVLGIWRNKIDDYGEQEGPSPPDKIPNDRKENSQFLKVVEAEVEFKCPH
jgi:hypothetical protein